MTFTDDMTLGEARALLRTLVHDGERCPCCQQFAKVYRRKIHATMARELITLYRAVRGEWAFLTDVLPRGGDLVKCRYWGLLDEDSGKREDGSSRSGYWRLTPRGMSFVNNVSTVQKYALIYDGRCLSLDGEDVSIRACLGSKFDYEELMAGV